MAILARALVASGWMLVLPATGGFALPSLALCPQQNPGLALAHESAHPSNAPHAHHGHTSPAHAPSPLAATNGSDHCALWAGSSTSTLTARPVTGVLPLPTAAPPVVRNARLVAATPSPLPGARAPPFSS